MRVRGFYAVVSAATTVDHYDYHSLLIINHPDVSKSQSQTITMYKQFIVFYNY